MECSTEKTLPVAKGLPTINNDGEPVCVSSLDVLKNSWPWERFCHSDARADGCPLLIAGSLVGLLGYEAYKYKKTGTLPGMPSKPEPFTPYRANPTPTPAADDIE